MELRDKIAGALYGMALGDAMGMPAELWGRERARKFFGGKITEFIDGPKENDVAFNYEQSFIQWKFYENCTNRLPLYTRSEKRTDRLCVRSFQGNTYK